MEEIKAWKVGEKDKRRNKGCGSDYHEEKEINN